jgi:hypothetical protein
VVNTIEEAKKIDINADYIAAWADRGQEAVLKVAGSKPSTGFINEPASAIREKAKVVLSVWDACDDANKKLMYFMEGFGSMPCLAARLTGLQEFGAKLILGTSLPTTRVPNDQLAAQLNNLYGICPEPDDKTPESFLAWLNTNHQDVVNHADFDGVWPFMVEAQWGFRPK